MRLPKGQLIPPFSLAPNPSHMLASCPETGSGAAAAAACFQDTCGGGGREAGSSCARRKERREAKWDFWDVCWLGWETEARKEARGASRS